MKVAVVQANQESYYVGYDDYESRWVINNISDWIDMDANEYYELLSATKLVNESNIDNYRYTVLTQLEKVQIDELLEQAEAIKTKKAADKLKKQEAAAKRAATLAAKKEQEEREKYEQLKARFEDD